MTKKKDVQRIVYSRCSPCSANRFFTVHCSQDLCRGGILFDEHKGVFRKKKCPVANMFPQKLTTNNEQCKVARLPCFRKQYFVRQKNGFVPYSSCLWIMYSGLMGYRCR